MPQLGGHFYQPKNMSLSWVAPGSRVFYLCSSTGDRVPATVLVSSKNSALLMSAKARQCCMTVQLPMASHCHRFDMEPLKD